MQPLLHMLSARPPEPPPGVEWVWLAALVVLTVLSYVARKVMGKANGNGNGEEEEGGPARPEGRYRVNDAVSVRPPAPRRRTRPAAVQVRHVRPVPTGPPTPPRAAGRACGTVPVSPGTITDVRPGTLEAAMFGEPEVVSVEVIEALPPAQTPGRLAPAMHLAAVTDAIHHRIGLHGRDAAVRAIIYAEILGPPPALRDAPECWET